MKGFVHRKELLFAIACVVVAAIILSLYSSGVTTSSSYSFSDALYAPTPAPDDIIILAIDDKSIQELGRWPWDRKIFASLIDKLQDSKIVGFDVSFFEPSADDVILATAINNSEVPIVMASEYGFTSSGVVYMKPLMPDVLTGHINVNIDEGGIVRTVPGIFRDTKSFSTLVAEISEPVIVPPNVLINYHDDFATVSVSDIISSRKSIGGDKIVLVGVTSPDFHDDYFTPIAKDVKTPGVVVHANAIATLREGDYFTRQSSLQVILFILLACIIVTLFFWRFSVTLAWFLSTFAGIVYYLWAKSLISSGIVADIFHPIVAIVLAVVACTIVQYVSENAHKKWVSNIFGKYVSKDVADEVMKLMHKGGELQLGGERKVITVLFSDIRGFTTLSESLSPEELVELLNEYLTAMTTIIIENKGVVDKYIGDAIMAFWNAPLTQEAHAMNSCLAAIQMKRRLSELQKQWQSRNLPVLKIGIGINTGEAVVGNMGSKDRLSYTAMGDTVNIASRLEGLTKEYGLSLLITESTYRFVKDGLPCKKIDLVQVKGKKKPILIYEVLSGEKNSSDEKYEEALESYFKGKFNDAKKLFDSLDDDTSRIMAGRCKHYLKHKPDDWTGVHVMKTK